MKTELHYKSLTGHDQDANDDGEVCQESSNPLREEAGGLELLEAVGDDEDAKEENDGHEEDVVPVAATVPLHVATSFATIGRDDQQCICMQMYEA